MGRDSRRPRTAGNKKTPPGNKKTPPPWALAWARRPTSTLKEIASICVGRDPDARPTSDDEARRWALEEADAAEKILTGVLDGELPHNAQVMSLEDVRGMRDRLRAAIAAGIPPPMCLRPVRH